MLNKTHTMLSTEMQECIQECQNCHEVCLETINHCLHMGDEHTEAEHIKLMLDCIEYCQTSANFMLRNSSLHPKTCGVCAEVCDKCAESCEGFRDDETMQECAEACRSCAESCREMAHAL